MRTRIPTLLLVLCPLWGCGPTTSSSRSLAIPSATTRGTIAITIDDVPWVGPLKPNDTVDSATERILRALRRHDVDAAAFATCDRIDQHPTAFREWVESGNTIGNHSSTHRHLDDLSLGEFRADVGQCKADLESVTGTPIRWFRYPFLQMGNSLEQRDGALAILREIGHDVAHVSVDTGEWVLPQLYVDALRRDDDATAAEIGEAYLTHVLNSIEHYESFASEHALSGPHVLLLHANALAADYLDELLTAIRAALFRIVPADVALGSVDFTDRYVGNVGLSWLYRAVDDTQRHWAWDDGQLYALRRRFGAEAPRAPEVQTRIDEELLVRELDTRTRLVIHEVPHAANILIREMPDGRLVMYRTPYTNEVTRRLLQWIEAAYGEREIVAVSSHFHNDGSGGNRALVEAGAEVYVSDRTIELLSYSNSERPAWATSATIYPLERGVDLTFGDERALVRFPGAAHAPDNVVLYLPEARMLAGGCMLKDSTWIGNLSDADLAAWPHALTALEAFPSTVVIPGHGDRTDPDIIPNTRRLVDEANGPI